MITLDTDLVTLLQQAESPARLRLVGRLASLPRGDLTTTIITYEEQSRGWLSYLARQRTAAAQVNAYSKLYSHQAFYRGIAVLPYTAAAAAQLERLRTLKLRVGTMDLKIAAIALSTGALLLTRNSRDFRWVPDLLIEDWSA